MNLSPKQFIDTGSGNDQEVLSRLKFLGHIQKEEKIDSHHITRQPNTILTKIYRNIVYPDNRNNTYKFVKDIITKTFEIMDNIESTLLRGIITDLLLARNGVENLKQTYSLDTKFCCDMDVLLEQINTKILFLKGSQPQIFENKEESNISLP